MYSSIDANKRNTVIIFSLFIAIIGGIGLCFSLLYDNFSIFVATLFGAAIYAAIEYYFSSKIALKMTGARQISRADSPQFYAAVETIAITAGLPTPKLYVIDDPAPNAFAAGINPESSIICATTGLLEIMDKSELEAVVAHEISHIKNYDIKVSMAAFALTAAIGFVSDVAWRIIFWSDDDNISPFAYVIGVILSILAPILAMIIRLAISREREFLADASAVMLTRHPEGMISALNKLRQASRPLARQSSVAANLFFINPLKSGFLANLFATHPPIEDRISRLEKNKGRF